MNFFRAIPILILILRLAPAASFDFAILGDRTGNAVPGVYEQVTREVAGRHPAFIINVGDSIEGLHDDTAPAQWEALRPIWKAFGDTPFYLVPGNHDIWSPISEHLWRDATGHPPQYSFDFKGAHITVLDNSRSDLLAPDQLTFLESDLAGHAAAQPKFVFFHRPSWLFLVKFQNTEFPLHRLARQYGVSFVISGHVHQFDRAELEGVQYIMVGSSGGSLSHGKGDASATSDQDGLYFGYAWVHVEGAAAKLDFHRVAITQSAR
jgi:Icc protein